MADVIVDWSGWGVNAWGADPWGTEVPPVNTLITLNVGTVAVAAAANVSPTGEVATTSVGTVLVIEGASVSVYLTGVYCTVDSGNALVWGLVPTTQTPGWQNIDDTQTPLWQNIQNPQAAGWTAVTT